MSQFEKNYSNIYNLIYKKKNYKKEFLNIQRSLPKKIPVVKDILDIGCGTGLFAKYFTKKYNSNILGIDASKHMLKIAKKKIKNKKIKFKLQKLENFSSKKKFGIIYSLFHVLSYQTKTSQIFNFFKIAQNNLKPKGLFIFDFWNKKAVLRFKPKKKLKFFRDRNMNVYNFVIPKLFKKQNLVKVNLNIYLEKNKDFINFSETHEMRYFDLKEIDKNLKKNNLKIIKIFDHIRNKKNINSWALTCIAQKIK